MILENEQSKLKYSEKKCRQTGEFRLRFYATVSIRPVIDAAIYNIISPINDPFRDIRI
jgi:hypothetical protein